MMFLEGGNLENAVQTRKYDIPRSYRTIPWIHERMMKVGHSLESMTMLILLYACSSTFHCSSRMVALNGWRGESSKLINFILEGSELNRNWNKALKAGECGSFDSSLGTWYFIQRALKEMPLRNYVEVKVNPVEFGLDKITICRYFLIFARVFN